MDAILCSINERLAGGAGQDFAPLTSRFLADFGTLAQVQDNEPNSAADLWKMLQEQD